MPQSQIVLQFVAMKKAEQMDDFFDERAAGYDDHMREAVSDFEGFYYSISASIARTQEGIRVLDIGVGTGLELIGIFEKAPNAIITGIDISAKMLDRLKEKYAEYLKQITLVKESYLTFPFGKATYDYIISVMTLHHLSSNVKCRLYERIRKALKNTGKYIEGDYIVNTEEENSIMREYEEWVNVNKSIKEGSLHIDIPLSFETQRRLLAKAGFSKVKVIRQRDKDVVYYANP